MLTVEVEYNRKKKNKIFIVFGVLGYQGRENYTHGLRDLY